MSFEKHEDIENRVKINNFFIYEDVFLLKLLLVTNTTQVTIPSKQSFENTPSKSEISESF
ncbi:hypothetical protein AFM12_08335 [Jiulongibacter sediminis]|uniref:Uncharacterized protein n=1 Tax=Jiulongibacter sediminis TaxID=1605367 RepID=A0A0P7C1S9_9BACT|nr:hypothetical protein AFM12_08335 [Jiulongibacter sediminis]TBX25145.1 hypothetical protein TK44_08340 [Jiulongibacter sediminis]